MTTPERIKEIKRLRAAIDTLKKDADLQMAIKERELHEPAVEVEATVAIRPPNPKMRLINLLWPDGDISYNCILNCSRFVNEPDLFPPRTRLLVRQDMEFPDRWVVSKEFRGNSWRPVR